MSSHQAHLGGDLRDSWNLFMMYSCLYFLWGSESSRFSFLSSKRTAWDLCRFANVRIISMYRVSSSCPQTPVSAKQRYMVHHRILYCTKADVPPYVREHSEGWGKWTADGKGHKRGLPEAKQSPKEAFGNSTNKQTNNPGFSSLSHCIWYMTAEVYFWFPCAEFQT